METNENNIPPKREAFGDSEYKSLLECINYYRKNRLDPPYEGLYQRKFEALFAEKMNGGFVKAVNSGSSASYVAIKALEMEDGSEILMSPVTDTSSLQSIILSGHKPKILDTRIDSYNTSLEEIYKTFTSQTKAIYLVHTYGVIADIERIKEFCETKGIYLIEDFSQSPFAYRRDTSGSKKYAGEFGHIACCSTMYRKTVNTSSSGGVIFTKSECLNRKIIELSDRGRQKWNINNDPRDGGNIEVISHNFNTSEFSCAVGIASLYRSEEVIEKRYNLVKYLIKNLSCYKKFMEVMEFPEGSSPFLLPVTFTERGFKYREKLYTKLDEKKIPYAGSYPCFAYDWQFTKMLFNSNIIDKMIRRYQRNVNHKNASTLKERTFNIFVHEGYTLNYLNFMLTCFEFLKEDA